MGTVSSTLKRTLSILLFFTSTILHGWEQIKGNDQTRTVFTAPVTACAASPNRLYVGATHHETLKEFSLAYLDMQRKSFKPALMHDAIINQTIQAKNPLYDSAIVHVAEISNRNEIAVVTRSCPSELYLIQGLPPELNPQKAQKESREATQEATAEDTAASENNDATDQHNQQKDKEKKAEEEQEKQKIMQSIFTLATIKDASGLAGNNGIVALAGHERHLFLAVKGAGQPSFGEGNSGIALVRFIERTREVEVSESEIKELQEKLKGKTEEEIKRQMHGMQPNKEGKWVKLRTDRQLEQIRRWSSGEQENEQEAAVLLNKGSAFLKVGSDLSFIDDAVDLYWSPSLERLYVSLKVRSGSGADAGARALAVGRISEEGELVFAPILADNLLSSARSIVGSLGQDEPISLHKVRTLQTTTGFLDYLIIQGGNGSIEQTKNKIFAVPALNYRDARGLVDPSVAHMHGTLAAIDAAPVDFFKKGPSRSFAARHFMTPPAKTDSVYSENDSAAYVGGGPLPGAVGDFVVKDDAIYAVVTDSASSQNNGIYHSQAIFDYDGKIVAWTEWKRMYDTGGFIQKIFFDAQQAQLTVLEGISPDALVAAYRSAWKKEHDDFFSTTSLINKLFAGVPGGIQGCEIYDEHLLCATGINCVVLAWNNDGDDIHSYEQGKIDSVLPMTASGIRLHGGLLADLGPITASAILTYKQMQYLAVGGVHGGALLITPEGCGWPAKGQRAIAEMQTVLPSGMRFIRISSAPFIRKMIFDAPYLYILTDTTFERVDVSSLIESGVPRWTRLADSASMVDAHGIFYDCVISGPLAVIAHSTGLSRTANGADIRTADEANNLWAGILLPRNDSPVTALFAVTQTGKEIDIARGIAGQLYAITGSLDRDISRIYRLVIHAVDDALITDTTVQLLHDFAMPDTITHFIKSGAHVSAFSTDGSFYFCAADQKRKIPARIYSGIKAKTKLPLPLNEEDGAHCITRILRGSRWGNSIVAGDFGLLVNG